MGRYDAAMKTVLQRWGFRIVEQLTGEAPARWHNIELPQVSTQYADLLFETASGHLWHIELQSANDSGMLARMLEYGGRVLRQRGQFPEQCVLYLGREPLAMEGELRGPRIAYSYGLMDARELDGEV